MAYKYNISQNVCLNGIHRYLCRFLCSIIQIKQGRYYPTSEALRTDLRLLEEHEKT